MVGAWSSASAPKLSKISPIADSNFFIVIPCSYNIYQRPAESPVQAPVQSPDQPPVEEPQEPPKKQLQNLINLYTQGHFQKALTQGSELLKDFPNSSSLYNIIGVVNKDQGKLEEAIEAYNKRLSLKPNFAEAYNNSRITIKRIGRLE